MPTELQLAQGFQTLFKAMTEFSDSDVVINDDALYDISIENAPYISILTASDFIVTPASSRSISVTTIPVVHVEEFTTWEESYNNLRNTRQAIIDEVFTGSGMSAGGLEGTMVREIRNLTDIEEINYVGGEGQTSPIFIFQIYGIEVELF